MADEPADLTGGEAGAFEGFLDCFPHLDHGELEDLSSTHPQAAEANGIATVVVWDVLLAARDVEGFPQRGVGLHGLVEAAKGWVVIAGHDHGSRGVAEQNGQGAIGVIGDSAHGVGADDADGAISAAADQRVRDVDAVDEPAAGSADVQGACGSSAEGIGHAASHTWASHLPRDRSEDDQVQIARGKVRILQCPPQGVTGERKGAFTLRIDDTPLADPCALDDPFVGRVHHLLEVGVGQYLLRHGRTDSGDPNPESVGRVHAMASSMMPSRWEIAWLTPDSTNCLARNTALVIVRATLEPWLMRQTPLTPSSGAPPYS